VVNLRGDNGVDLLVNFPAVAFLTTDQKPVKLFDDLMLNSDYCSVALTAPGESVRLAFQFEYAK